MPSLCKHRRRPPRGRRSPIRHFAFASAGFASLGVAALVSGMSSAAAVPTVLALAPPSVSRSVPVQAGVIPHEQAAARGKLTSGRAQLPPQRTTAASTWWSPPAGSTWQIQYAGRVNTKLAVDVYNLDGEDTSKATITALKSRGVRSICYINAGAWENWRGDKGQFPATTLGRSMDGWAGERWLDIRRTDVLLPIMQARMAMCADKGFDAVDADNVMGYQERTGFPLTGAAQLTYNTELAKAAHSLGLGFGLKNDSEQIEQLLPFIDFAVNEECVQDNSCGDYQPVVAQHKAVFHIEYSGTAARVCAARPAGFSTLVKRLELGPQRVACPTS